MRTVVFWAGMLWAASAGAIECRNLVAKPYNSSPKYFAPDGTRGEGIQIWIKGALATIPDTRAECLPISLRLNNPGAMKTPAKGPWAGQVARDDKGHAVFGTVEQGMAAWGLWMSRRAASGQPQTAFSIMSRYAPPNDCVGSVGVFPNCPYGPNPTREYADQVAASVGKKADDPLSLNGAECNEGRNVLYSLFQQIVTFEAGANFCGKEAGKSRGMCHIDRVTFDRALDGVFASADGASGRCSASK